MKKLLLLLLLQQTLITYAQLSPLTVDKIMRDPKWIGSSPSNLQWTADGKQLLFNWNPDKAATDSLYYITPTTTTPQKSTWEFRKNSSAWTSSLHRSIRLECFHPCMQRTYSRSTALPHRKPPALSTESRQYCLRYLSTPSLDSLQTRRWIMRSSARNWARSMLC